MVVCLCVLGPDESFFAFCSAIVPPSRFKRREGPGRWVGGRRRDDDTHSIKQTKKKTKKNKTSPEKLLYLRAHPTSNLIWNISQAH